ncbi:sarcinarray family MAST domain-containing protein [Methanococcoides methylutens]|uniref:sarcinarray family MAST domain-containing protein n=1 Tax=Methanococcoides methylutens TaxID=2226 RepID=UPI0040444735
MRYSLLVVCLILIVSIFSISPTALAYNPYGEIYTYEAYYNDKVLELDAAKPTLKVGEPFKVKVEFTVYQEYKVSGKLTEIESGNFEVIDGPSEMDTYSVAYLNPNESHTFEWTLKPTDGWVGGSLPLNFHYSIVEKYNPEPVVNDEFTIVYPYISTEYYDGPATQPAEPPETDTNQTPAFTLPAALLAIALVALRKKC